MSSQECVLQIKLEWPHESYTGPAVFQYIIVPIEKAQKLIQWVQANPNKKFDWPTDNGGGEVVKFKELALVYSDDVKKLEAFRVIFNSNMICSSDNLLYYIEENMKNTE